MSRIFTLITALLFCSAVFAQQVIEWREIETATDSYQRVVYHKKGKKKPLNGTYRIKRGLDEEVVKLKKELMHGEYKRLRDGVLRETGVYEDGQRSGLFVEYYQDGQTHRKDTPMLSGKINGKVTTYFSDGKTESEKEYRRSQEHGIERQYSPTTGELLIEGQWKDGKREGKWIKRFDAGNGVTGVTTMYYRDGNLNGSYITETTKDGKPYYTTKGEFTDGLKSGKWTQYDAINNITLEWNE